MNANFYFDVVVVGNAGIDTNVYLNEGQLDFAREGHFTENRDYLGQSGGFCARGFARLGLSTAFIGSVGKDFSGDYVLSEFSADRIDTSGTFIDPAGTGRSVNLVFPDGTRRSFYDGKGHLELMPDLEKCRSILKQTRLVHFSIPNWARQLLPIARESGRMISCDLQDIPHPDDPYRQDFIQEADILFFSSSNLAAPEILMEKILRDDPDKVLVSGLGAAGCALGTNAGIKYFPPIEMDRPIVDTNGAGDSLAVGFLSAYVLEHKSLEEAVKLGQIAARYTCSLKGSSSQLITRQELEGFLQNS